MSIPIVLNGVQKRKVVVFSGGSGANSLVDVFDEVIEKNNCSLTYVIPISDNGGSSSELIRVFGGPGIGDVRSTSPIHYRLSVPSSFRWLVGFKSALEMGVYSLVDSCCYEYSDILWPPKVASSV